MRGLLTSVVFLFLATTANASNPCPSSILGKKNAEIAIAEIKKLKPDIFEKMPGDRCEPKIVSWGAIKTDLCRIGKHPALMSALGILVKSNTPVVVAYSFRFKPETHQQIQAVLDKQYPKLKVKDYPHRLKDPGHWEQTAVYKHGEHYLRLIHPIEGSRGMGLTMMQFIHKDHLNTVLRDLNSCK